MIDRRTLVSATLAAGVAGTLPIAPARANELEEIPLWPGTPPGRGTVSGSEKIGTEGAGKGAVSNIAVPRLRVHRPTKPNGIAVIICGGGGYFRIQLAKESGPAAAWLQSRGYTAFELIYRLPGDGWEAAAPFADAQRAMKIVRSRAADFGLLKERIGIMGMSAGGHLAGFTALQPSRALYSGKDGFEAASARPDFAALLFPVVSMRPPFTTTRTRRLIVGEHPDAAAQAAWSLDTYAAKDAPPIIQFSAADDPITPPGHNIALYEALIRAGAHPEMHIFASGGHGWGLGTPDEPLSQWPRIFEIWLRGQFRNQTK
jgi:acetyl esterase/lipase